MRKNLILKTCALVLALLMALGCFAACGEDNVSDEGGVVKLSFSEANSIEDMKKLDGKTVSIIGYMSTLSPVNGEFMYLMNMPYQSCPFCIPNTTQLSNTLAVYAKNGKSFEFTDLLIRVEGVLEFGDYTDEYGYQYSYRIKDATYKKVDSSELGEEFILWQQLASTGVVADVYTMYDYVHFLCFWGTYSMQFDSGKDYLYPEDARMFITTEGAQFNYGYKTGYFDNMIRRIEEVDPDAFEPLEDNIRRAKALAERALADLNGGNYKAVSEYTDYFGDNRTQYKMNDHDAFDAEMQEIFDEFSAWIAEWEL